MENNMIGSNPTSNTLRNEPQLPCLAMRPREAAAAIGISERLLWEWTDRGLIPHIRMGKVILYPVDVLKEWLIQKAKKVKDENPQR